MGRLDQRYSEMLKAELLKVAQRLGLTGVGRLRKDEIIDLIRKAKRRAQRKKVQSKAKKEPSKKRSSVVAPTKKTAPAKKTASKSTKKTSKRRTLSVSLKQPSASSAPTESALAPRAQPSQPSPQIDPQALDANSDPGDDRIVLMPRDASQLYAYWAVTEDYKLAARDAGGQRLALRLYDVSAVARFDGINATMVCDQVCEETATSAHIPNVQAGRSYLVEIGYRGDGDNWFPLSRSNRVQLPRDQPSGQPSDQTGIRFVTIASEQQLPSAGIAVVADEFSVEGLANLDPLHGGVEDAQPLVSPMHVAGSTGLVSDHSRRYGTARAVDAPIEVAAELLITGRAVPDSSVLIVGQAVVVGPDGNFSLRVPISASGIEVLSVEARGPGGRQRIDLRLGDPTANR